MHPVSLSLLDTPSCRTGQVCTSCRVSKSLTLLARKYTLFANASMSGLPPVRALFYEFPDEPELFTVDRQWLVGSDILVTPVLTPGAATVDGNALNRVYRSR